MAWSRLSTISCTCAAVKLAGAPGWLGESTGGPNGLGWGWRPAGEFRGRGEAVLKAGWVGMNPGEYIGGDAPALTWLSAGGTREWLAGELERVDGGTVEMSIAARNCCI